MSHNQSRFERSDSSQYRKSGQSGGSAQARNFSGSGRKGGGITPPPASSSLSSNWSFKKSNKCARRTVEGAADALVTGTVKPTTDIATQKNAQAVPKAPSSQPAVVSSDTTTPVTPTKGIPI
ncbi:hypothetical protein Acr_17g0004240 [Actinidia rufa]|uniref:Uncharacterized protein n=1 Tax=Actinidia rufa TaxID=165716 RepID=A0A7J0G257_9ERIC|nr:hypothetical protein Acr_17g0004240 [Actinidia rufa]